MAEAAARPSRAERQDAAERVSQEAEAALPEIDQILERFDGHRLAEHPNAVGAIPVETTVRGVIALAAPIASKLFWKIKTSSLSPI